MLRFSFFFFNRKFVYPRGCCIYCSMQCSTVHKKSILIPPNKGCEGLADARGKKERKKAWQSLRGMFCTVLKNTHTLDTESISV